MFVASMFVPEATFLEVISGDGPDMGWGGCRVSPQGISRGLFQNLGVGFYVKFSYLCTQLPC